MQPTVCNPDIPYQGPIENLKPGVMIIIKGTSGNGPKFAVSFHTGPGENSNIAFHFEFRFRQQATVKNSLIERMWQKEERDDNPFPLQCNEDFQLMFLLQYDKFKIEVNEKDYAEFNHRVPYSRIENIRVCGEVQVAQIQYGWKTDVPMAPPEAGYHHANLPFEPLVTFPFSNIRDHAVMIAGIPFLTCKRFMIDLKNEKGGIFFHMSSRFPEKVVVRNSKFSNDWEQEERQLTRAFPFVANQRFNIEIFVNSQHFRVSVDGVHLFDFNHRRKQLGEMNSIRIFGDVVVSTIDFR